MSATLPPHKPCAPKEIREPIKLQRDAWLEYLSKSSSPIAATLIQAPADAYYALNHNISSDFWQAILTEHGREYLSKGIAEHFLQNGRPDLAGNEQENGWYGIQTTELLADFVTNYYDSPAQNSQTINKKAIIGTALASILVTATGFGLIGNHAGATEQSTDKVPVAADSGATNPADADTMQTANLSPQVAAPPVEFLNCFDDMVWAVNEMGNPQGGAGRVRTQFGPTSARFQEAVEIWQLRTDPALFSVRDNLSIAALTIFCGRESNLPDERISELALYHRENGRFPKLNQSTIENAIILEQTAFIGTWVDTMGYRDYISIDSGNCYSTWTLNSDGTFYYDWWEVNHHSGNWWVTQDGALALKGDGWPEPEIRIPIAASEQTIEFGNDDWGNPMFSWTRTDSICEPIITR